MVKETLLGFLNGLLVGVTAGIGMLMLCLVEGRAGTVDAGLHRPRGDARELHDRGLRRIGDPLLLKRAGADPATASGIFLTTASDIASMGMFLAFATMILL